MNQFITRLCAVGLHGRFDIDIAFSESVNIIHGANGTGKTTLLHILNNATNLDIERFADLRCRSILIELSNGRVIKFNATPSPDPRHLSDVTLFIDDKEIATWPPDRDHRDPDVQHQLSRQYRDRIRTIRSDTGIDVEATYFPAFRTMIEAWSSLDLSDLARHGLLEQRLTRSGRLRRPPSSSRRRDSSGHMPTTTRPRGLWPIRSPHKLSITTGNRATIG